MKYITSSKLLSAGLGFAGLVLSALMAVTAQAAPTAPYSIFQFSGNCVDCAAASEAPNNPYPVTATLTLQNYLPDSGLSPVSSFFSLTYGGSNLIDPFTLHADSQFGVASDPFGYGPAGVNFYVNGLASETSAFLDGQEMYFLSMTDGSWSLGFGNGLCAGDGDNLICVTQDIGDTGQWTFVRTVLPVTNDVPEPGSLLLMGGALVALAVVRKRRTV